MIDGSVVGWWMKIEKQRIINKVLIFLTQNRCTLMDFYGFFIPEIYYSVLLMRDENVAKEMN